MTFIAQFIPDLVLRVFNETWLHRFLPWLSKTEHTNTFCSPFVLWRRHMSEVRCRVCRPGDEPLIKAALLAQLTAGRRARSNNWNTHCGPQAWQIRARVNSGSIMQTHHRYVEKHSPFTKSLFSSPDGEDKLSKLAPQILTRRNWWSPARCQGRGGS